MNPDELSRYSRQIILPQIGVDGQQALRDSRVLLIGMGGLGSPAALYLAAAGVGTLGLADFDTVAGHNLQRQVLHDHARIGDAKIDSAADRLRALDPTIQLELHPAGVNAENIVGLFSNYDLILDGTDNFPTRYMNNDAATLSKKPLVYGSVFQFEGQVSVFHSAAGGPCYRCLFPKMPDPGTVPNCEEAGVFGALCGVVGSWQAMEAIKVLTGTGEPLIGRLQIIDALNGETRRIRLKPDPECPCCGENPTLTKIEAANYDWSCTTESEENKTTMSQSPPTLREISVQEAAAEKAAGALLLDVREDFEHAIVQVEGSRLLPMSKIPDAVEGLPKDQTILCLCHHGARSLRVASFLAQHGVKDSVNVAGGIDQWAAQLDPDMARY
tara:strand:- start:65206 stop:66360 length:1155 start_codon:yes stop_codon:yes gene_type:complete